MRTIICKVVIGIILSLLATIFLCTAYATTQRNQDDPHHWFVEIGVGKSYDYASSNVIVPMAGSSDYMIFQTDQAAAPPFFSAGVGHLWSQKTNTLPFISVGLQYRYTSPIMMSGIIYEVDGGQIDLEQSLYSRYQIKQQSCSVLTKVDLYRWQNLMPYFSFGLGASWNRINHFSSLAFDPLLDPLNLLTSADTTADFTYSLGVGIDYKVNQDLWLSLGYSYDDFGKNEIGQLLSYHDFETPLTPLPAFVKNASLHAHNILFTARYLFA